MSSCTTHAAKHLPIYTTLRIFIDCPLLGYLGYYIHILYKFNLNSYIVLSNAAAIKFLGDSSPPRRKVLAVYPIGLFYFIIAWLVVSLSNS